MAGQSGEKFECQDGGSIRFRSLSKRNRSIAMPIPIHVLSLIHATDRRASVSREFSAHGLEFRFFDAIDGAGITDADFHQHYDSHLNACNFKRPLSRGEVACALGHRAIWRQIAEGEAPVALVCEDDALLAGDIADFLRRVADNAALFERVMIKLDSPARNGEIIGRLADTDLVLTRRLPAHTTGYLLGRHAAGALSAQTGAISRPIDADLKHYWEHRVPILLTRPQLLAFRSDAASSLAAWRDAAKPSALWRRFTRNLQYQSAINLGRLRFPLRADRMPELLEMRRLLAATK